jgi:hypothetical protein
MGAHGDDGLRRVVQESGPAEAGVSLASIGIEDPKLGPPTRRPEAVPGDGHVRPLADDIAAEADPAAPAELEAQRGRLGDSAGKGRAETGRFEDHEARLRSPGKGCQASKPIGQLTDPAGSSRRQVEDEQIDRPAGQQ